MASVTTAPRLRMPAATPPRKKHSYGRMAELRRGVVLIVDDDADTRELYHRALTSAGLRCVVVASPADAIQRASDARFDVIVMDLGLPRLEDGLALTRKLRQQDLPPPIVAVSGHPPEEPETHLFAASLIKPVDPQDFLGVVLRVLGQARRFGI